MYESMQIQLCSLDKFLTDHIVPQIHKLATAEEPLSSMKLYLELLRDCSNAVIREDPQNIARRDALLKPLRGTKLISPLQKLSGAECVDPTTNIVDAFLNDGTSLRRLVPSPEWGVEWLLEPLRSLGMSPTLSIDAITACAAHLDNTAGHTITDAVERQSCLLVEETCR
jgi:hypothetical protein